MTLFSGKYDVYGSRPNQINLAAELEAQGVANHTVAGTISSIFVGGAVSLALGGGLDRLSTGISNVKNIFQTVFNNNDEEEDYFAGLGGSAPENDDSYDAAKETENLKKLKELSNLYDLYMSTTDDEKPLLKQSLQDKYDEFIQNGGTATGSHMNLLKIIKDVFE